MERITMFREAGIRVPDNRIVRVGNVEDPFEKAKLWSNRRYLLFLLQTRLFSWQVSKLVMRYKLSARRWPRRKKLNRIKWKACCAVGFIVYRNPWISV